jgi:hypothetical protein
MIMIKTYVQRFGSYFPPHNKSNHCIGDIEHPKYILGREYILYAKHVCNGYSSSDYFIRHLYFFDSK